MGGAPLSPRVAPSNPTPTPPPPACLQTRLQGDDFVREFDDHHDCHGDPWADDLDAEGRDLANIMERLVDQKSYDKLGWRGGEACVRVCMRECMCANLYVWV